ncbi:MAG: trypsin-like serine protease [Chloroflexota bacterium]
MATVVGNMSTIVTALHTYTWTREKAGNPTVLAVKNKDGTVVYIPMSEVGLAYGPDDQLIMNLKAPLPDGYAKPAEYTEPQSITVGQTVGIAYMNTDGEFRVLTTQILGVQNGRYFVRNPIALLSNNDNFLLMYGGDSGGGVFVNGQFVGINVQASMYWFDPRAYFVPYPSNVLP